MPTSADMSPCDPSSLSTLLHASTELATFAKEIPSEKCEVSRGTLEHLIEMAHREMAAATQHETRGWRRLYTDASMLLACADVLAFLSSQERTYALSAVSRLDHAIVIAGAPGTGRLDLILDLIEAIQTNLLGVSPTLERIKAPFPIDAGETTHAVPPRLPSSTTPVPRLDAPPSLAAFVARHSKRPFVLPGFLLDAPALTARPWRSLAYLRAATGPGRVVPVEVGSDYRAEEWTQRMMPWDEFLDSLEAAPASAHKGERHHGARRPVLYLAQHSLFTQFPVLKDDVFVPDYVYSDLDPPEDYPQYVPPANEDRLVLNAWLGPAETVSPAHTVSAARGASRVT